MTIENVKCPICEGPMVSRKNSKDGTRFWGCKMFPECRGTRDSMGRSKAEKDALYEEEDDNKDRFKRRYE